MLFLKYIFIKLIDILNIFIWNNFSELHEADFSCENQETDTPSGTATPSGAATPSGTEITPGQRRLEQRRQFTPQLSSESESDPTPIPVQSF